jgi:hypothetical protein
MNRNIAIFLTALIVSFATHAAEANSANTSPMSDKERVDLLIRQNQVLLEENQRLKGQCERPKSREEIFASCMQAAKGETSPMSAESIGGHCDQLLKK